MKLKLTGYTDNGGIVNIGDYYAENDEFKLYTGDIVEMIDGKTGVVLNGRIITTKESGSIDHVINLIKSYTDLTVGEIYLNGHVEIVEGDE